ncbi:sin3 histone deacetylase corepressor complex component SDS3 isoform X2 [Hyalella azteca]|nr:sin3 histone deacetylase corepressor complex component SDS3 isoform X2 [Hyalella azteca]
MKMDEFDATKFHARYSYSDSEDSNDGIRERVAGLKEQVYHDKLEALKRQLAQLDEGTHPEYRKKMKKVDQIHKERLRMNEIWKEIEIEKAEKEHILEKQLALRDFEEKKAELKENLLLELEDKRKVIEQERFSLDLNGDSMEYKAVSTRKLRHRGTLPTPTVEKRRKPVNTTLQLLLEEREVDEDLRLIRAKSAHVAVPQPAKHKTVSQHASTNDAPSNEPKIENGKLYFDKKWFHKGQAVMVDCKDGSRFNAILSCAEANTIHLRKSCDNSRLKISLAQLAHGKYLVRRRNTAIAAV